MAESAEDRKAKAAARQAKLQAKAQERLAKITGAAKGEGRVISDAAVGIAARAPTTPPVPTSLNPDDDPAEIDLALSDPLPSIAAARHNQQLSPFGVPGAEGAFPGFGGPGAGGAEDPFAQMMAQMMGGGAPGAAGGAPGADGGLGGMFGMMGGAGTGGAGAGASPFGGPPVSPFPPTPKTFLDRVFPLIHLLSMVGLVVYAVGWLEPATKHGKYGWMGVGSSIDWSAWGALASNKPLNVGGVGKLVVHSLAEVPLLWLFVSIELVLQTTRLFLLRNRAPPPGILSSILPLVSQFSPQLGLAISTGVRYLDLVSVLVTDISVVIFCVGVAVIVGKWKTGGAPSLILNQAVEAGGEAWDKIKGEL